MKTLFRLLLLTLLVTSLMAEEKEVPRLAVVITVDQMRADFLERFRPYFGEGGFKRLLEGGADYRNCHYQHAITSTAPGHATIFSGVNANIHGIIGNEWLDPQTFIQGNSVEDAGNPLVGLPPRAGRHPNAIWAAKAGRSPKNFLGTTLGDRLKQHYGAAAKVYGVADKDRSAILPAGTRADGAYWTEEGIFVTSTYYRPELPAWVREFNERRNATQYFGQVWDRLLPPAVYDAVQGPDDAPGEQAEDGLPVTMPKRVDGGEATLTGTFFNAFDHAPWNNDLVAEMAAHTLITQQLGQDGIPDLLAVGFSQTDKAGHAYGPDSHEIMDSYLRLDRTLAVFLDQLDATVGLQHCVIVLTADHGVCPLPEKIQAGQGPDAAGRVEMAPVRQGLATTLDAAFGPLPDGQYWIVGDGSGLRLNPAALATRGVTPARAAVELKQALLQDRRFVAAYTREELTAIGPLDAWGEMMRRSYHPDRSPEVMFVMHPNFLKRRLGTDHGTPHPYDTHVPQVWFGAGVKSGVHDERVAVEDIAPTLAGLLGVDLPEARGRRLF